MSGATSADLTVATTDAADVPAIEADGAKAAVVKTALEDLRKTKTKLDGAVTGKALDTPVRYVDVRTNRVTVQATSRAAADTLIAAAGVTAGLVDVKVSAEQPRALHDVRGGDAFYIDDQARCSVGFSVTKGEQQGFATAGHCGKAGATTTGFNKVAQGTFQNSVFPGQDMAWVGVNSDWTATPAVKGEGDENVQTMRLGAGPGGRRGLPVRVDHRLALRNDRAARHQRQLFRGHRRRRDPHHGVRRAG